MKAAEITDEVIQAIEQGNRKFIRLNYANGDMVGHTGIVSSVLIAVAAVDLVMSRLLPALEKAKGVLMLTADHGNADQMFTVKKGKRTPMVAHTLNPVPFLIKDYSGASRWQMAKVANPSLSHVAATICTLLGYQPPEDYDPPLVTLG